MNYALYWRTTRSAFTTNNVDTALRLIGEIIGCNGDKLVATRYPDGSYSVAGNAGRPLDWTIVEEP